MLENLHPPIHIIPRFDNTKHKKLAEQLGLVFGPLAHVSTTRSGERLENFLVQIPKDWNKIGDTGVSEGEKHGTYFTDGRNRRRIRFGDMNNHFSARAELLCRYAIQEWWYGNDHWIHYVRKIVGGEDSIHCRPHEMAHVVFEEKHGVSTAGLAYKSCEAWLDKNFPDWQDPLAYWND